LDTYDDLANALTNHIQQVVTHYGSDNVIAWDVVNEAISDNSTADNWGYKTSTWYPTVPDFVTIAFTTARDACPSCSLFYNDYSIASASGWMKSKSDAVYALVQQLLSDGVPIDGVGMQLHISMNFDDFDGIRENIQRLYDLGLQTHFTEIDVACGNYPDYDCPAWGDTEQQEQASVYQSLLEICLEEPGCTSFETWGFTDKYTWLTSEDGTDQHPLPFDENYEKKPAYDTMLDILTES
jgi:endo-1,4-beta-xylanase